MRREKRIDVAKSNEITKIINWKHVTSAIMLNPSILDELTRYGVVVYFVSGKDIILWYDTPEKVQGFFAEMRHAFTYPCPGLSVIYDEELVVQTKGE